MLPLLNKSRTEIIGELKNQEFDVLIIGGGITGAGIALDAASRGLKVALIEKGDFASGTSSKSTKLIHGGLRYLKQFDFWLVKEVGTERAIVHKLAPHLVVPEKMLLPIIEGGTYGSWLTSFGLKIYDILAHVEGDDKRKMLDKKEALSLESLLPENILKGAGYYAEYRTDDARLTIEVLKSAVNYSAKVINYCKATNFIYKNNQVKGVSVIDSNMNTAFDIQAKYTINATGPWVDHILKLDKKKENTTAASKKLRLTKGVHLVLPYHKLPIKQSIYFDVPDGRMMFAIPRNQKTYIGTTDTTYFEDINDVRVNQTDALYLISATNNMFPKINLSLDDVQSSWAGLRPLIHEEGKPVSELSRKDEIYESSSGLISIAGGKLTGYRKMAERITDLVSKKLVDSNEARPKDIQTEDLVLTGGNFKDYNDVLEYTDQIYKEIQNYGFNKNEALILVHRYGKQTDLILQKFDSLAEPQIEIRMAKAELWFCLRYEMVMTPLDFMIRRTGILFFDIEKIQRIKDAILKEFSEHFNWSQDELNQHSEDLNSEINKTINFD